LNKDNNENHMDGFENIKTGRRIIILERRFKSEVQQGSIDGMAE
jgi:hypothetical protein